jgi:hypothetical protein
MRVSKLKQPTRIANRRGMAIIYVFIIATFVGAIGVAVVRVSRNETLIVASEQRSFIAEAAATGAAHRGVALLRRDPKLLGTIAGRGPEVSLGVTTNVGISQRSDRGVALRRRDPRLLGTIAGRGPEVSLGVTTNIDISQRSDRGVKLRRRNPRLLGTIAGRGPEVSLGVTTNIDISQRSDGKLVVSALATYQGFQATDRIIVEPTKL